jgi:hypothetical protein
MTLDEVSSIRESIIINNYRVPCDNRKHVWDTHIVKTFKDGDTFTTEMKKCIKCNIIRDIIPKKEEVVDTY